MRDNFDTENDINMTENVDTENDTNMNDNLNTENVVIINDNVDTENDTNMNDNVDTENDTNMNDNVDTENDTNMNDNVNTENDTNMNDNVNTENDTNMNDKVGTENDTNTNDNVDTENDININVNMDKRNVINMNEYANTNNNTKVSFIDNYNFNMNYKAINDNNLIFENNPNKNYTTANMNIKRISFSDPGIKRYINYLIEKEINFNEIIKSSINILIAELVRCVNTNDEILNKVDIHILFKYFPDLYNFSTAFLNNLKICLANYDEIGMRSICEIFRNDTFDCSLFVKYSENYHYSIDVYDRIMMDNVKQFNKIENILKYHKNEFRGLSLKDILDVPFCHFVNYNIFLKEIQKKVYQKDIYDYIEVVIQYLRRIGNQMDNKVGESIQVHKFFCLNKIVMNFPAYFITSNRKLIFDFEFMGDIKGNLRKYVYLFNDCLIVIRPSKKARKKGYHCELEKIAFYNEYDFVKGEQGTKFYIKCIKTNNAVNNNNWLYSHQEKRKSKSSGLFGCFKSQKRNSVDNDNTIYFYFDNPALCNLVFEECKKQRDIILGRLSLNRRSTINVLNDIKHFGPRNNTRNVNENLNPQNSYKGRVPTINFDSLSDPEYVSDMILDLTSDSDLILDSNQISNKNKNKNATNMNLNLSLKQPQTFSNSYSLQDTDNSKSDKENNLKEQPVVTINYVNVKYDNDVHKRVMNDINVSKRIMNDNDVHNRILNENGVHNHILNNNNVQNRILNNNNNNNNNMPNRIYNNEVHNGYKSDNNNNIISGVLNNDSDGYNGDVEQRANMHTGTKYRPLFSNAYNNNNYGIIPPFGTYKRNKFDIYSPYRTYPGRSKSTENFIYEDDSLIDYLSDNGPRDPDTSFILY